MAGPFKHPWTTRIPLDEPIGPAGYRYGVEMQTEIDEGYHYASINTYKYAPTVCVVGPAQRRLPVKMWNCQKKARFPDIAFEKQMAAVPAAPDAEVPPDSDGHIVFWQPSRDMIWELWKARKTVLTGTDVQWEACWGGRLTRASTTCGAFPFPYGATASGLSLLAGLITLQDLAAGTINHALAVGVDRVAQTVYSWPANRTDGVDVAFDAIPEGQRLRLDPDVKIDELDLSPLGAMVAHALQNYGCIIRDRTIGSVSFYAERPTTPAGRTDPYRAYYGGRPKYEQLDGIPWYRLSALALDYGKPASLP